MFQANGLLKFTEEDIWDDGCQPDTATSYPVDVTFTGKTAQEVIDKIADYLGCTSEDYEKNACDEPGRVDFAVTEDADGCRLLPREVKLWKKGQIKAWYAVYSAYIEKLTPAKL
jgi:hypothetical protein